MPNEDPEKKLDIDRLFERARELREESEALERQLAEAAAALKKQEDERNEALAKEAADETPPP